MMSLSMLANGKRSLSGGSGLSPSKKARTMIGNNTDTCHMTLSNDKMEPFATYADSWPPDYPLLTLELKSEATGQPEVITLSDSEDDNNVTKQVREMTKSNRQLFLVKLKNQLLQEETKLVLLQKLRGSQVQPRNCSNLKLQVPDLPKHPQRSTPPPKNRKQHSSSHSGRNKTPPPSLSTYSGQLYQRSKPLQPSQSQQMKAQTQSYPPPLVNLSHVVPTEKPSQQPSTNGHHPVSGGETHTPKREPTPPPQLSADSKRSLVKLHCRKELQQSLLNVARQSRNKAMAPEVNFIPSLSSAEFVCLVGMEEIVKRIISPDQKDIKYVFNPFICVQCKSDFTPVWKRDKPGSKNVICEICITSNQKKSLRIEHTAKLKAEFDQTALREQDYERRIANGSPLLDVPAVNVATIQQSATYKASRGVKPHSSKPAMPKLTSSQAKPMPYNNNRAHSSRTTPNNPMKSQSPGGSNRLTQPQLQQQQALLQAQQQMNALMTQALVYPQLQQFYGGMSEKQMSDIQKQYMLEMINSSRNWKNK